MITYYLKKYRGQIRKYLDHGKIMHLNGPCFFSHAGFNPQAFPFELYGNKLEQEGGEDDKDYFIRWVSVRNLDLKSQLDNYFSSIFKRIVSPKKNQWDNDLPLELGKDTFGELFTHPAVKASLPVTFETGDFPRNRYGLTSYNPITHANLKDEEGENIGIAAIAQGKDILVNAGFSVSLSGHQPQDVVIPVYEAHKDIDGKKLGIVFADKATGGSDPVKHRGKSGFVLVSEKGDVVCSDNETYLMDSRDPYIGKLVIIKDDNGPKQARVAAQKYGDRKTVTVQTPA